MAVKDIFKNKWSLDLKDPQIQSEYRESRMVNVRGRTPFVFVLLVLILIFRVARLLAAPAETKPGEMIVLYFQLATAVIPLVILLVCLILSYKWLNMISFAASGMMAATILTHLAFNESKYSEHMADD
jgi:uncharacterized BrkB/YihY/UPF0761 family membrane protein